VPRSGGGSAERAKSHETLKKKKEKVYGVHGNTKRSYRPDSRPCHIPRLENPAATAAELMEKKKGGGLTGGHPVGGGGGGGGVRPMIFYFWWVEPLLEPSALVEKR